MNRLPNGPVRTPRVLDLSSYAVLTLMCGVGAAGLESWPQRLLAVGLCLVFGLLYAWTTSARPPVRSLTAVYLVQTAAVTGAVMLGSTAYEAFAFLLMLLAVHVSSSFPLRIAAVWVLGLWAIHAVVTIVFSSPDAWFIIVFNLGIYLVCGAVGHVLRELAASKDELEHALRRLHRAQDRIRSLAVDEERGRLARDLHDSVKQNIFAAGMQVATARALLPAEPGRAEAALGQSDELIRHAGADLGLVIHELMPVELEEIGLPVALRNYVGGWSKQSGIEACVDVEEGIGDAPAISEEVGYALLRVAQEALANVSRHSGAGHVEVHLSRGGPVRLAVQDDGSGFAPSHVGDGFGLHSMRERVGHLGGTLRVSSAPGRGTAVEVQVGGS